MLIAGCVVSVVLLGVGFLGPELRMAPTSPQDATIQVSRRGRERASAASPGPPASPEINELHTLAICVDSEHRDPVPTVRVTAPSDPECRIESVGSGRVLVTSQSDQVSVVVAAHGFESKMRRLWLHREPETSVVVSLDRLVDVRVIIDGVSDSTSCALSIEDCSGGRTEQILRTGRTHTLSLASGHSYLIRASAANKAGAGTVIARAGEQITVFMTGRASAWIDASEVTAGTPLRVVIVDSKGRRETATRVPGASEGRSPGLCDCGYISEGAYTIRVVSYDGATIACAEGRCTAGERVVVRLSRETNARIPVVSHLRVTDERGANVTSAATMVRLDGGDEPTVVDDEATIPFDFSDESVGLIIRLPGYEVKTVTVRPGQSLGIALAPETTVSSIELINATGLACIARLDAMAGVTKGSTSTYDTRLSPGGRASIALGAGSYRLSIDDAAGRLYWRTVDIPAGETTSVTLPAAGVLACNNRMLEHTTILALSSMGAPIGRVVVPPGGRAEMAVWPGRISILDGRRASVDLTLKAGEQRSIDLPVTETTEPDMELPPGLASVSIRRYGAPGWTDLRMGAAQGLSTSLPSDWREVLVPAPQGGQLVVARGAAGQITVPETVLFEFALPGQLRYGMAVASLRPHVDWVSTLEPSSGGAAASIPIDVDALAVGLLASGEFFALDLRSRSGTVRRRMAVRDAHSSSVWHIVARSVASQSLPTGLALTCRLTVLGVSPNNESSLVGFSNCRVQLAAVTDSGSNVPFDFADGAVLELGVR